MNKDAVAESNQKKGSMNCAQSVFLAFSEEEGLKDQDALRVAMLFGGGMGGTAKTCGAVTGAYMVLGLKLGSAIEAEKNRALTHKLVTEFNQQFTALHGSTECKELLGCDVSTPEGEAMAEAKGVFANVCPILVRDAARVLQNMKIPV